jgi:hypothetical protein
MLKEKLQATQYSVGTASDQFADVRRAEKTASMDVSDDFEVSLGQMNWRRIIASLKTWSAKHPSILTSPCRALFHSPPRLGDQFPQIDL